jgi:hypothetical protein
MVVSGFGSIGDSVDEGNAIHVRLEPERPSYGIAGV